MRWLLALFFVSALGATPPPVIFYTDLVAGPKVGGPGNNGTILTICGRYFGSSRGASTVTIGGGAPSSYILWGAGPCGGAGSARGLDSISVQIGSLAVTGAVVVTVGGVASNSDKTFTVLTWSSTNNRIFCEDSVSGADSNNGQCAGDTQVLAGTPGPWKTIRHLKAILNTGDTVYFGAPGVDYTSETDTDACGTATIILQANCAGSGTAIAHKGTIAGPISLVGYPGQTATAGCATTACPPAVFWSTSASANWSIINFVEIPGQCLVSGSPPPLHCTSGVVSGGASGGIRLGGNGGAVKDGPGGGIRIINNNSQCPNGNSTGNGCLSYTVNTTVNTPGTISNYVLGNHWSNYTDYTTDTTIGWRHTVAMYLGFDSDEVEVAWNDIDGSAGYASIGVHIHSSAIGSTGGFPLYGIHIHDNYIHDTPAGNDLSTFNPSVGSGVEFYNNLYVHQGDCFGFPNAVTNAWPGSSYRRMGGYSVGQPSWDENWSAMHGTINIFNNTYVNIGNCAPEVDGWLSLVAPSGSSASTKPPPDVTICASSCSVTQSGTLPAATPTYAADNVGFQVTLGSSFITSLYDDGAGNLLENGVNVGTFNYGTGAYSFTLTEGSLNATDIIKYRTIYGYNIKFQNNIIWQPAATPTMYIGSVSSPILYPKVSGDHNLFYTVGGQTVPSMFTSNIGSNADPLFVSNGTLGNIPTNGDFHLQAASPAAQSGVVTAAARDYDGLLRVAPWSVGAFEFPAGGINMIPAPPNTTLTASYSYTATASGTVGACGSWTKSSGTFPTGLSINSGSGVISGTVGGSANTFNFVLQCTDTTPTVYTSLTFSIVVSAAPVVTTTSLPPWTTGTAGYSQTLTNSGGTAPFSWDLSAGTLPTGMSLSTAGVITGTPSGTGTSSFTVRVTDAANVVATKALSILINAAPSITTSSPLPSGTVTIAYSQTIAGTGGTTPYVWTVNAGSLPVGLTLHSATGVLDGTPTVGCAPCSFTVRLTDAALATVDKVFALTIATSGPPIVITPTSLTNGIAGASYSQQMSASGGVPGFTWSISSGSIPGVTISGSGLLSGTPRVPGTYNIIVRATDSVASTQDQQLSLLVLGGTVFSPLIVR